MESVHFPLWTYNPATGKVKLDLADKSDTVSFAMAAGIVPDIAIANGGFCRNLPFAMADMVDTSM